MWCSQTRILPLVDLVITHGGTNTTTEALRFGRPMILPPLFWDQHDNARRMAELGYGVRLDPYRFTDSQLHGAIGRLLGDTALRRTLTETGGTIRASDGLHTAADLIERVAAG
ncbi:glycosyltransferase [Streptomyces althioticus]|uniref:glycosyltransferase n=1 Tax=Streptomyces althioticus TaxID=83380 RepID=UPI00379C7078